MAAMVRMLAYNGSIPGPTMKVQNGSGVIVDVESQGDELASRTGLAEAHTGTHLRPGRRRQARRLGGDVCRGFGWPSLFRTSISGPIERSRKTG